MAGAEETLVLTADAVEGRVRAALASLNLGPGELLIEPAAVYPGQTLAIDLTATDVPALEALIARVQAALRRDVGITNAATVTELEARQATSS